MIFREKIQGAVGDTYRFALFYTFPGGLRFELSTGDSPLDQVLTALRKATAICDDVFMGEERILVHLQVFASASRFGFRQMLRELQLAGIVIPRVREVRFVESWISAMGRKRTLQWVRKRSGADVRTPCGIDSEGTQDDSSRVCKALADGKGWPA